MKLFRTESSDPTENAQRNLMGRTHYVDPGTLRSFRSKVLGSQVLGNGLMFGIVTSDAIDHQNRSRGFNYVIFDLWGEIIARTRGEGSFRSSKKATDAMWIKFGEINPYTHTQEAINRAQACYLKEMAELKGKVVEMSIGSEKPAA